LLALVLILHSYNVYLIWLSAAITSIWGFFLYFTRRENLRPWRISLLITLALGLLQGVFGVTLLLLGQKPGGGTGLYYLHYVYGGIVALGIPLVWLSFTTNGKNRRQDLLIYSIGALVLLAAGVRAWMTGSAG
jgi:heme A synthase